MSQFKEETIRKVADLSRLELSDQEVKAYTTQIASVLEYVGKLNELNTANVEPMTSPLDHEVFFNNDQMVKGLGAEKMLESAPEAIYENYKVPQVIGGSH